MINVSLKTDSIYINIIINIKHKILINKNFDEQINYNENWLVQHDFPVIYSLMKMCVKIMFIQRSYKFWRKKKYLFY